MKLQLFVSSSFAPCREATRVWTTIADENGVAFTPIDIETDAGRAIAERLGVSIVPALVVDDRLLCVGVPTAEEGRALLAGMTALRPSAAPNALRP